MVTMRSPLPAALVSPCPRSRIFFPLSTPDGIFTDKVLCFFTRPAPLQVAGDPRGYRDKLSLKLSDHSVRLVDLRPPEPIERTPIFAAA